MSESDGDVNVGDSEERTDGPDQSSTGTDESAGQPFAAALLASSPEGVLVVDASGEVQYEGPTITSFVGDGAGEIVGSDLRQHVHPDDRTQVDAVLDTLRAGEPVERVECRFEPGESDATRVRIAARPTEQTSVDGHVLSLRETTEQSRQLERFASIAAHDLRNPLTGAMTFLEVARETGDDDAFEEVEHSLARMERLIEDLLWLAQEGREIGETEPVELEAVAREAWEYVPTSEATLVVEDAVTVEADRDRLLQTFENCFRNAIEHGGTRVTVTVGSLDDGFYLEDDGPGIPEADRQAVFESGFTTGEEGTGFGLAIVKRVAEAHGWSVRAEEGAAGGARFTFRTE